MGNRVTSIGNGAFSACYQLSSVTFEGLFPSHSIGDIATSDSAVAGICDLREKYLAGGPGRYVVTSTDSIGHAETWEKR